MRVELFKGEDGWRIRLKSRNGRTLTVSEAYYSHWNAKRAAKKNFPGIPMVEV
jgi:uncharacterized protein YegP (UPF0339 family)